MSRNQLIQLDSIRADTLGEDERELILAVVQFRLLGAFLKNLSQRMVGEVQFV